MITGNVTGSLEVIAHFQGVSSGIRDRMLSVMRTVAFDIQHEVVANKLSGQVLKVRTGDLRRSISAEAVSESQSTVSAVVGTDVRYAAVHEYGGTFEVPAHQRMLTMMFGRRIENPYLISVREHPVTFPMRSFLRTSLQEKAPAEIVRIREAMAALIEESRR